MRLTWLALALVLSLSAWAKRPQPQPTPARTAGALSRMDQILQSMQSATQRGIAHADAAAAELNARLEALSKQVKGMLENVQHAATAPDVEMRENMKGNVQDFSGFVQKLDTETWRKVHQQTQELMKEAESIQ